MSSSHQPRNLDEFGRLLIRRTNALKKRAVLMNGPAHKPECRCTNCTNYRLLRGAIDECVALAGVFPHEVKTRYCISQLDENVWCVMYHDGRDWQELPEHYISREHAVQGMNSEKLKDVRL